MTTEKMLKIISENEYSYYGLRNDNISYNAGDTCNPSHQLYQDDMYDEDGELLYPVGTGIYAGYFDAGELDGTCAIAITEDTITKALELVSRYDGEYIHLIAGNYIEDGADNGEYIIKDAIVLMQVEG